MATPRKKRNSSRRRNIRKYIVETYGQRCWVCGAARNIKDITMDHVIPLNLNGQDSRENMKPACDKCNQARGAAVRRLLVRGFHRKRIYSQFDLMLERMVFVKRQLNTILKENQNGWHHNKDKKRS